MLSHAAALFPGGSLVALTVDNPQRLRIVASSLAPMLTVNDASKAIDFYVRAFGARALSAGATEVFPVDDQPYGLRQGRVEDPFGHHWLIGTPLTQNLRVHSPLGHNGVLFLEN